MSKRSIFAAVSILAVSSYFIAAGYADTSDSQNIPQWQTVQLRVTAYCPCQKCCGSYAQGITASGHKISKGDRLVAADKTFSFGTEMIIPGYNNSKPVKVLDRGGAIKGNKLDVYFDSHQEALEWGVQNLDVKIIVENS